MTRSVRTASTRTIGAGLAAGALLLAGATTALSAYAKPVGGKWTIQNQFDYTDGGAMAIAKSGRALTKLTLIPGPDFVEKCGGSRVRLTTNPRIKKFSTAGGRWAVGRQKSGSSLIVPIRATFEVAGEKVDGKLVMLFDEKGRLAVTARVELPTCTLNFNARKPR